MIDRAGVLECLKELGAAGGEPERYAALVDFACSSVYARLKDKAFETDSRAVFLAAAQANYMICCGSQAGGFDSFTAGDVSFSGGSGVAAAAGQILAAARSSAADLVENSAFAFKSV